MILVTCYCHTQVDNKINVVVSILTNYLGLSIVRFARISFVLLFCLSRLEYV